MFLEQGVEGTLGSNQGTTVPFRSSTCLLMCLEQVTLLIGTEKRDTVGD